MLRNIISIKSHILSKNNKKKALNLAQAVFSMFISSKLGLLVIVLQ